MTKHDDNLEKKLQEKGLNAPRVTKESIDHLIADKQYYVFPGTTVTVCLITLENGFSVVGESACASPENFDKKIGRDIAYQNAYEKIWALEGYLLKQKLYDDGKAENDRLNAEHEGK